MERYRIKFWENVNELRLKRGLSWSRLSILLKTNYTDLLQAKRNMNLPRIERLKLMADALECSPEDLIKDIFN